MTKMGMVSLLIAVGVAVIMFCGVEPYTSTEVKAAQTPLDYKLSQPLPQTPVQPAKHGTVAGAELIHDIGKPLLTSDDATQRQALAKTLREVATNGSRSSAPGVREPQALDILSAAYFRETSNAVKIEIISALSEFSIPEAADLINRALEDGDPAVRKAAQQAKIRRDRRMLFLRCCE